MVLVVFLDIVNISMSLSPPEAMRFNQSHELRKLFRIKGVVFSVTRVSRDHAPENFRKFAPYDLMIVELANGSRRTFMGMFGEKFAIGDEVECVVGSFANDDRGVIPYRIKVRHPLAWQKT